MSQHTLTVNGGPTVVYTLTGGRQGPPGPDLVADRAAIEAAAAAAAADALATAADRVQTGLDAVATAADRVQTGLDRLATGQDAAAADADAIAPAQQLAKPGGQWNTTDGRQGQAHEHGRNRPRTFLRGDHAGGDDGADAKERTVVQ